MSNAVYNIGKVFYQLYFGIEDNKSECLFIKLYLANEDKQSNE